MKKLQNKIDQESDEIKKKEYYSSSEYKMMEKKKKKIGLQRLERIAYGCSLWTQGSCGLFDSFH